AGVVTDGQMLFVDAGVAHGHVVTREVYHFRPEPNVERCERSLFHMIFLSGAKVWFWAIAPKKSEPRRGAQKSSSGEPEGGCSNFNQRRLSGVCTPILYRVRSTDLFRSSSASPFSLRPANQRYGCRGPCTGTRHCRVWPAPALARAWGTCNRDRRHCYHHHFCPCGYGLRSCSFCFRPWKCSCYPCVRARRASSGTLHWRSRGRSWHR